MEKRVSRKAGYLGLKSWGAYMAVRWNIIGIVDDLRVGSGQACAEWVFRARVGLIWHGMVYLGWALRKSFFAFWDMVAFRLIVCEIWDEIGFG
jgi:hypothetical protein